jgi:glucosylceramidase
MFMPPGSEARLGRLLRERLRVPQEKAYETPSLLAFDHNWEAFDYPSNLTRTMREGVFAGTAWHCYGEDKMAEAQDALHKAFPEGEIHMTECVGDYGATCDIDKGMEHFGYNHEWDMSLIFLGNAAHWGQSSLKWLSVLDEHCGPSLEGPVAEGSWHGRPLVTVPSDAETLLDIRFNQDYWSLSHMSRFVRPGSQRLLTIGERQGSIMEAFRDEVAGTVTLIVMNRDHAKSLALTASYGTCWLRHTVPEWGTAVLVWPETACVSPEHDVGSGEVKVERHAQPSFGMDSIEHAQAWQFIAVVGWLGVALAIVVTMLLDGLRWRSKAKHCRMRRTSAERESLEESIFIHL